MARKLAALSSPEDSSPSPLERMILSLEAPLSPEGKRVLASARVGLKLLQERASEVKRAKAAIVPQLHQRRIQAQRAVRGGTPVCESNLPDSIQEMLSQYRRAELEISLDL